jgi:RHS repeat-associated protein
VSAQGEVEWAAQLDAWGHVMAEYNPQNRYQPIRLPGQHEDESTGLYYNRHRYYDSMAGRYINQDPIGLEGGVNISAYVNDPVSFFDAVGLQKVSSGKTRTGTKRPALFDKQMPQKDLDRETAESIALPEVYNPGNLANGKKPWQSVSPYDYTQYCKKWSKAKLTCQPNDAEPGRDVKYPPNYMPSDSPWKTSELPPGYTCDNPTYFPEIENAGSSAKADSLDAAELISKMLKKSRSNRK